MIMTHSYVKQFLNCYRSLASPWLVSVALIPAPTNLSFTAKIFVFLNTPTVQAADCKEELSGVVRGGSNRDGVYAAKTRRG